MDTREIRDPLIAAAFSGGWDSTAMALRMAEIGEHVDHYLCSRTGDEMPDMRDHLARMEAVLGRVLTTPPGPTLAESIASNKALPNFRMRFCTRLVKIKPCLDWIRMQPERVTLCVGLHSGEEERQGIYSNDVDTRFPLREWGWDKSDVIKYVRSQGIEVPTRTDCARCYGQRLGEWWRLWMDHPEIYEDAVGDEAKYGHTYRSAQRDSWPAGLAELRSEFDAGRMPRGASRQLPILGLEQDPDDRAVCRVCTM